MLDFWLTEWLSILVMLASLIISAFFSGSETALFSLSNDDIAKLKRKNFATNYLFEFFRKKPERFINFYFIWKSYS